MTLHHRKINPGRESSYEVNSFDQRAPHDIRTCFTIYHFFLSKRHMESWIRLTVLFSLWELLQQMEVALLWIVLSRTNKQLT